MRKLKLAYLVSHPIQYQAPLLRRISLEPEIDLAVFFSSDLSVRDHVDEGFGRHVSWDVPLLEGYRYEFLPALGGSDGLTFFRPLNYGLGRRLKEGAFDALWVHGWGNLGHMRAIATARKLGIKVLLRGEATLNEPRRGPIKRVLRERLIRQLFRYVDVFLAIGRRNEEFYLHYGVDPSRIRMVPYAVDNAFFRAMSADARASRDAFRADLGLAPGRPVILYAGKLMERKRPDDLLDAYAGLSPDGRAEPRPYLLFVGDGELRGVLESRASRLGWNSIRFLGFKNQTELPAYYDLCDVFVLPSADEPWGLVVNEAMNAGRAVIVSDRAGCAPDLVRPGENGCTFSAGDVGALRRALEETLTDPGRLRRMGEASLRIIEQWSFEEDVAGLKESLSLLAAQA